MNMLWFVLFLVFWSAGHSFTASGSVKAWFERRFGKRFVLVYYRLGYNIFSVISFLPAGYFYFRAPDHSLYTIQAPISFGFYLIRSVGLLLMYLAVKETGLSRFAGFQPQFDPATGDATHFVKSGIYSFVRHPIYTGTYLVLLADPSMTWNKLAVYLVLSLYLLIGIQFEERRLINEFGDRYLAYKSEVPMVFPTFKRKNA